MTAKTIEFEIDTFMPLHDLSDGQLRAMSKSIECEAIRYMNGEGWMQNDANDRKMMDAINLMTRMSNEILRRDALPSPGPILIHYEIVMGGMPQRFNPPIMCF